MNGNDQTTPSEWREEMLEGVGTFRFPKATSDAEVKDFFDKKVIPNLPKYLPKGLADVERFDQEIDATQRKAFQEHPLTQEFTRKVMESWNQPESSSLEPIAPARPIPPEKPIESRWQPQIPPEAAAEAKEMFWHGLPFVQDAAAAVKRGVDFAVYTQQLNPIEAGFLDFAVDTTAGFLSPAVLSGFALAGASAVAGPVGGAVGQRLVALTFLSQMAKSAPYTAYETYEAYKAGDTRATINGLLNMALTTVFGGLISAHVVGLPAELRGRAIQAKVNEARAAEKAKGQAETPGTQYPLPQYPELPKAPGQAPGVPTPSALETPVSERAKPTVEPTATVAPPVEAGEPMQPALAESAARPLQPYFAPEIEQVPVDPARIAEAQRLSEAGAPMTASVILQEPVVKDSLTTAPAAARPDVPEARQAERPYAFKTTMPTRTGLTDWPSGTIVGRLGPANPDGTQSVEFPDGSRDSLPSASLKPWWKPSPSAEARASLGLPPTVAPGTRLTDVIAKPRDLIERLRKAGITDEQIKFISRQEGEYLLSRRPEIQAGPQAPTQGEVALQGQEKAGRPDVLAEDVPRGTIPAAGIEEPWHITDLRETLRYAQDEAAKASGPQKAEADARVGRLTDVLNKELEAFRKANEPEPEMPREQVEAVKAAKPGEVLALAGRPDVIGESLKPGMSPGPGAAAVGTTGGAAGAGGQVGGRPAALEDLTSALKSMPEVKYPFLRRIGESFKPGEWPETARKAGDATVAAAKRAGRAMYYRFIGLPEWDSYLKGVGEHGKAMQDIGRTHTLFWRNVAKFFPNKRLQAALSAWIEAGGDVAKLQQWAARQMPPLGQPSLSATPFGALQTPTRPMGAAKRLSEFRRKYEDAQKLTPDQVNLAQNIQNYFEQRGQEAIDAGIIEHVLEDYIDRVYPRNSAWKNRQLATLDANISIAKPFMALKRIFETDADAERAFLAGEIPAPPVQDAFTRLALYDGTLNKAIADRTFIKDLHGITMPDGRPMTVPSVTGIGIETPEGQRKLTLVTTWKKAFDLPKPKNWDQMSPDQQSVWMSKHSLTGYVPFDHPALKRWRFAIADAADKPILAQGATYIHPDAIGRIRAMFEPSALRRYAAFRGIMTVSQYVKGTMLDLSAFHLVQLGEHALFHTTLPWDFKAVMSDANVGYLQRHGLQLFDYRAAQDWSEGVGAGRRSLFRHLPGLGPVSQAWQSWLFEEIIPQIKAKTALNIFERNQARFADHIKAGKVSLDQVARLSAEQANAAFGHLNYAMMGRHRTTQDMLSLTLLAPDFLEARFRFAGQTLTKYGAEQRRAMLLGMATTYFIARVANKVLNDDYHWEFENAFRLVYKGRAYGMRTVFGDMLHLATDFGRFWYWRLNPLTGRTVLERFTNRDAFGRKRDLVEQLADFLTTPRPIWSRSDRERKLWENFMQAMGITVSSYTDIDRMMRMASDWNKKQGKPERGEFIYDPDKDPLRTLKVALKNKDDATAVKEINRLIDSGTATGKYLDEYFKNYSNRPFTGGKQKENQFIQSLSADDRKLYWRAWEAKQEIGKGYGDAVAKALQLNPNLQDKPDAKLRPPRKTRTRGATYGVGPSH